MAAYEDATQLTGNRLAEKINLGRVVRERDVRIMLERRVRFADSDLKKALASTIEAANTYGRLGFIRDLCTRVNGMAEKEPVTLEIFTSALSQEVKSRR